LEAAAAARRRPLSALDADSAGAIGVTVEEAANAAAAGGERTRRGEGFNHRDTESTEIRQLRSVVETANHDGNRRYGAHHGDPEGGRVEPQRHREHRDPAAPLRGFKRSTSTTTATGSAALTTETRRWAGFHHRDTERAGLFGSLKPARRPVPAREARTSARRLA
jgi:hypothetical protein